MSKHVSLLASGYSPFFGPIWRRGQQRALLGASSGPTVASLLARLLLRDSVIWVYNPTDSSTASMSESRTSTITQVSQDGPIGRLFDQKGTRHLVAPADNQRPLRTNGMTWDGSLSAMSVTSSGLPATIDLRFIYKGTDGVCIAVDTGGVNPYAFNWNSASTGAVGTTGTSWVDGVQFTDRGDLGLVMLDGDVHRCEHRALSMTSWTALSWQGRAANRGAGVFLPLTGLDPAQADYSDTLADVEAYENAIIQELALGN